MKRRLISQVVLCTVLALIGFAGRVAQASPLQFFAFHANLLTISPNPANASTRFTGQLSWTPTLDFGPMGIRGELGASLLNSDAGTTNTIFNYEAFLRFQLFPPVDIELGGGMGDLVESGRNQPNRGRQPRFQADWPL